MKRSGLQALLLGTINQVQLAIKTIGVYPQDHPITIEILKTSYEALAGYLKNKSVLTLSVNANQLFADDIPIKSKNNNFSLDLKQRAIESMRWPEFFGQEAGNYKW
jgi:hypothetical protein